MNPAYYKGVMPCLTAALLVLPSARAADSRIYWPQNYERSVTKWQEIVLEKNTDAALSNHSHVPFWDLRWHVYSDNDGITAEATADAVENHPPLPSFEPIWAGHESTSDTWVAVPVDDGWIVAFDVGEFGAAVVWFNSNGTKQYEISPDFVQTFLKTPEGIFAQGGLESGALYRVDRRTDAKWRLTRLITLVPPFCPIAWMGDGKLFIDIAGSFYSYSIRTGRKAGLEKLTGPIKLEVTGMTLFCGGRYAVTPEKIYTASKWTVAEINLRNSAKRFLVPDSRFSNDTLRTMLSAQSSSN